MTDWTRLSEKNLLNTKIADLDLKIENTFIEPLVEKFHKELDRKNLSFKPQCFIGDEWFCPVDIPAIGIPFYLSHLRLRRMEQKFIYEVEGGTKTWFMKLIRHEAGHAFTYAYRLNRKAKYRKLFGLSSQEYLDTYRPRPYSKSYVMHLDNWYAQSHPDEDFAETFAVWLTPKSNWKRKYKNWKGAYEKLLYMDELMHTIADKPPVHNPKFDIKKHHGLNIKLKTYFARKRKLYEEDFPDFYDKDLLKLFTNHPELKSQQKAHRLLQKEKSKIITAVAKWTREKRYTISDLLTYLIERSEQLELYVRKDKDDTEYEISAYVSSLIMNNLFTGRFKRSK